MLQQLILIEFSLRFQSRNKFCTCAVQSRHSYIYICAHTQMISLCCACVYFVLCVRGWMLCIYAYTVHAMAHELCGWMSAWFVFISYWILEFFCWIIFLSSVFLFWNRISILLRMENFSGYRVFFFSYSSEEIINENLFAILDFSIHSNIAKLLYPKAKEITKIVISVFIEMVLYFFAAFFPSAIQ